MALFDVLVVGELNVDVILDDIQGFPVIGKEILARDLAVTLGSSSAIFASNLSSLGASVAFLGKMGRDSFSRLITDSLENKKVDTGFIISSEEFNTGLTVVMNYDMDRANITFPGAMEQLGEKEIPDSVLKNAGHLHVSSIFLQSGLIQGVTPLFRRAKKLGLTTSLDPQWDPSEQWQLELDKLLPYVDIFMPNTQEFQGLTAGKDIPSGLEKVKDVCHAIVIKDGINGAHLYEKGRLISRPAFLNSDVVDCIGAGDSFDAGFIYEFVKGAAWERCLEVGNIMGAINTLEAGGTTAFKSPEAIRQKARQRFSFSW